MIIVIALLVLVALLAVGTLSDLRNRKRRAALRGARQQPGDPMRTLDESSSHMRQENMRDWSNYSNGGQS
jgi:hypothetical protein